MNTETTEAITETKPEHAECFENAAANFVETRRQIEIQEAFIAKHREALTGIEFYASPRIGEIRLGGYSLTPNAREIAPRFGAEGWSRERDGYTCGKINWVKKLDGVRLKIEGAEQVSPSLVENVRL